MVNGSHLSQGTEPISMGYWACRVGRSLTLPYNTDCVALYTDTDGDGAVEEDEEFDWEVDQVLPESDPVGIANGFSYGFDDKYR